MRFTLLKGITDPINCHMPRLVTERKQQTPQTNLEHAERSKKDALSAHIQDPTVQKFFNHFSCSLTFVTALRCVSRFSFFRRIHIYIYIYMLHEYIYIYIYIYVRQVSLVLFLCKLSHELRVALTLTCLPEFVLI